MSIFIVEHEVKGYPLVEVIRGVEDIDLSMFSQIKTLWVCDNETEVSTVEKELKEKHARHSKQT
jgi:hypothetical protein